MSDPEVISAGGFRWHIAPEHKALLLGPDGLRLDEWLRTGQARIIKQGPHRTVYRVALPKASFFLKHNRVHNVRAYLRQLVRPSKSRIEHDHARAIAARGIPTFFPLAVGEQETGRKPGDSYLITASLDEAESLCSFIEESFRLLCPARQARIRQHLARALARLIAKMHAAGVTHNDLHAGNLLVRLEGRDEPRLFLVDLHAISLGEPLSWKAARNNLVMLNRWFILRTHRADRLRFWREYFRTRADGSSQSGGSKSLTAGETRLETRLLARELEKRTLESNVRFWRNRDRRCLVDNRYYRRVRSSVAAGHAVTDLDESALSALLADPDEPFRRDSIKLLKDSRSSTVAELELPIAGTLRPVIYKRFRVTAWSDPLAALVRRTPALRSWVYGHGLRERGLPTPRPLAVFHRRRGGFSYEGYLVTEKVPDAVELQRHVADLRRLCPDERRRLLRARIDQIARLVREMHKRRLSNRDLKAANVLVAEPHSLTAGGVAAAFSGLWLIDLVGITDPHRLTKRRRVQNLARLHASFAQGPAFTRTDKLRFLRVYLQWGLAGRESWKRWWKQVDEGTKAKIARNRLSGRPLA